MDAKPTQKGLILVPIFCTSQRSQQNFGEIQQLLRTSIVGGARGSSTGMTVSITHATRASPCSDRAFFRLRPGDQFYTDSIRKRAHPLKNSIQLTGTQPGVRGLAPKHVGRKEIPCKYLQCGKENR
jgi:hypothetical protein